MSKHRRIRWYGSPSQKFQTFFLRNDLKHLFGLIPLQFILRKEKAAYAVLSFPAYLYTEFFRHFYHKFMRDLCQDTDAVPCLALGVFTGPVLQIFHNL